MSMLESIDMKWSPDLSLVLSFFNEGKIMKENVNYILKTLSRSGLSYEVILIDDGSRDNTSKTIEDICSNNKGVCRGIYSKVNIGRGAEVANGFREAKGKVVGFIDTDCEVSPIFIPEAVEMILQKKADVVVGRRFYYVAILSMSSLFRGFMSFAYRKVADLFLNTKDIDTASGYKFFNRKKILPLLNLADHPHWFWDTQVVVIPMALGLKVTEIPVLFIRKPDKKSSVKFLVQSVDYLINLWRFRGKLKQMRSN